MDVAADIGAPARHDGTGCRAGRRAPIWLCGAVWAAVAAGGAALAADEPGQIQERIERQTPEPPPQRVEPDIRRPAPSSEVSGAQDRAIVLTGIDIAGNTAYSIDELAPLYEGYLGREIRVADVERILEAITEKYQSDGYVLSRAIAPPQDVEFGVLRIEIVEGYVAEIRFAGGRAGRQALLDAYAAPVTRERPLTLATLERSLLIMSDLPGITVKPAMREIAGGAPGAYELVITLEQKTVGGIATLSNRGTTAVGPLQALAALDLNSALGLWEHTRVLVFTVPDQPREIRYGQLSYDQPFGSEGTVASVSVSRSVIQTRDRVTGRRLDGEGTRYSLALSHPIVRSREENLYVTATFDVSTARQEQVGNDFTDKVRSLRGGASYVVSDSWDGVSSFATEVSRGLGILDASGQHDTNLSRFMGRAEYTKVTADVARQQKILDEVFLVGFASGQWSPHRLLSSEEFTLGGARYGRAFDPGELSGSDGVAVSTELRYTHDLGIEVPKRLELYGFWDWGAVWPTDSRRESLSSAGGGVRLEIVEGFTGGIEIAKPLTRSPVETDDREPRAFFFFNLVL